MVKNIGFFGMLHTIYNAIGAMASAVYRGASALDNLGQWAEEQTGSFVDEARMDREEKLAERRAERLARRQAQLNAPTQVTDVQSRNEEASA